MEIQEICGNNNSIEQKEKVEAYLVRLKAMRRRVTELREQCESLKRVKVEYQRSLVICSECGKRIEQGQEIMVKDSSGNPMDYYHRECFGAIWAAQTWRLDYSSNGFLKRVKEK
jgi:serine protease inhibitor ecotin